MRIRHIEAADAVRVFPSRRVATMMVRRLEGTQPRDEITVKKIAE